MRVAPAAFIRSAAHRPGADRIFPSRQPPLRHWGVNADHDAFAVFRANLADHFRRPYCDRPQNNPLNAGRQNLSDGFQGSDTAAQLNLDVESSGNLLDCFQVDRPAGPGPVQVHDM
jgi:hypothetical protein